MISKGRGTAGSGPPSHPAFCLGAFAVAVQGAGGRGFAELRGQRLELQALQGFAGKGQGEEGALQRADVSTEFPGAPGLSAARAGQGSGDGRAHLRRG